jgi:hypothetical protein
MPSSFVIDKLGLEFDRSRFDRWIDASGKIVFIDPSVESDGPSFALFDCKSIDKMLSGNALVLVWLIGGEKMIVDNSFTPVKERMVFNTMLWTAGDGQICEASHNYIEGKGVKSKRPSKPPVQQAPTPKKTAKKTTKKRSGNE